MCPEGHLNNLRASSRVAQRTILEYINRFLGKRNEKKAARLAHFRLQYQRFREILILNDSVLGLFADIEDYLSNNKPFSIENIIDRIKKARMDVFVMAKNLNLLSNRRYENLYESLARIDALVEKELSFQRTEEPLLLLKLDDVGVGDALLTGQKMARLGEVKKRIQVKIPDGFVVTTSAFNLFMESNGLWDRYLRLEVIAENGDLQTLSEACKDVADAIRRADVPQEISDLIYQVSRSYGDDTLWAVRSSASGEDVERWSHAGIFHTELGVSYQNLIVAYKKVLESIASPHVITYRFEKGLPLRDLCMAVGFLRMVDTRCSGILFTKSFQNFADGIVYISLTKGSGDGLTSGTQDGWAREIKVNQEEHLPFISREELKRIVDAGKEIEKLFDSPQDIEWAISNDGDLYILQARPLFASIKEYQCTLNICSNEPIMKGGVTASLGTNCGKVFVASTEQDIDKVQQGDILVTRHAKPYLAKVMSKVSAIISEVGNPTGHTAILAREWGTPMIVGMKGACSSLKTGEIVTVDANACAVYKGQVLSQKTTKKGIEMSPSLMILKKISSHLIPLNLVDIDSRDFSPENAKTLHDITRFVHEKIYEVMFHFSDFTEKDEEHSMILDAYLPLEIRIFDVGGGVSPDVKGRHVKIKDLTSCPMKVFLEGMLKVKWDKPRPISAKGFLSVLGQGMLNPPPITLIGRLSYAIISDKYMNFSTKAGYHFSTIDCWCGNSVNKNYIHFRFNGGAADTERRIRRVRFLQTVLEALDFTTSAKGDMLWARLDKIDHGIEKERLFHLGRLVICARQLDMLMDSDESPDFFAQSFLKGEMDEG